MPWKRPRNRRLRPAAPEESVRPGGRGRWMLTAALVGAVLVGALKLGGALQRLDWLAGDALQRAAAALEPLRDDLCFVILDQASLDAAAQEWGLSWPWRRDAYANVLQYLAQSGARQIFFDFLFTETSADGMADDQALADAIRGTGNVYLDCMTRPRGNQNDAADRLRAENPGSLLTLAGPASRMPHVAGVNLPVAPILAAAAGIGDVRFTPDPDGVLRRVQPIVCAAGATLSAFGLAPRLQADRAGLRLDADRLASGGRSWPLDAAGNLVLRYPGSWERYCWQDRSRGVHNPRTYVSLIDVIRSNQAAADGEAPAVPPATFKDKVVFIGSTAEGLMDLRDTPLELRVPGVYLVAAVWAAGENGRVYDERWRSRLAWPLLLVFALLGAVWGGQPFLRGLLGFLGSLLVFTAVAAALFWFLDLPLELAAPALALGAGYGLSLGFAYRSEQKQKHFIQGAFTSVLSPSVLAGLMRDPKRLAAGGELAELTVYFSDLAGFTSFSEKLGPHQLVEVLNLYLGEMIETIVDEYAGYVDKFIGDAVMAFWGAPLPEADHAARACFAALRNQERLQALQGRLRSLGLDQPLGMRIGIHTGPAVVGMMGSPKKLNYTIIGDTVNLASRLESVNKQFGTQILISGETFERVAGRVVAREVDRIRVKGKTRPTRLYELVGLTGAVPEARLRLLAAFDRAAAAYFGRDFAAALRACDEALALAPDDRPSAILRERCAAYRQSPPPPDWDGVTTLTSK